MSKEAAKRIAANRKTRATKLDLSDTDLHELPQDISRLTWLRELDVGDTPITDLSPLASLRLTRINARSSNVKDLTPLAHMESLTDLELWSTRIDDLAPLKALTGLRKLEIDFTEVSDLSPLRHLPRLEHLSMMRTRCRVLEPLSSVISLDTLIADDSPIHDLGPLRGLVNIGYLSVGGTKVADLQPILGLPSLHLLELSNAHVRDIAQLVPVGSLTTLVLRGGTSEQVVQVGKLTQLRSLDLSSSVPVLLSNDHLDITPLRGLTHLSRLTLTARGVTDLSPVRPLIDRGIPVVWSEDRWADGICVKDCPLTTPPAEIARQGPEAVANYFREVDDGGVDHLYEAKLLLLGEGRAGKTSLLHRLYKCDEPLPSEQETTKGIEIHRQGFKTPDGHDFRLNVWDFGGQEIYHATHQFFLTKRSLYVMVDDTAKDHRSASDDGFKYWLDLVEVFGGKSPVLIFQNEKGGRSKAIDLAGIKGRFGNVLECYGGDLKRADAADRLREAIEWHASRLDHVGEELPARWVLVRASIEEEAKKRAYMTLQDYFDVYKRHLPFDEVKALHLSRYLHDLGVFLHFQDDALLRRTVILRNTWATEAVFRILDSELVKKNHGRFGEAQCVEAWRDSVYADMHPELLALMQRFEMCYALPDTTAPTWLAPLLLPPSKPAPLEGWTRPGDLVLRYRYDFMPKGLIGRLTVRLHRYVLDTRKAWTTGVLFEHAGTEVLVERLPQGPDVELRARGVDRKALLSVVAGEMDALNQSFDGLSVRVHKLIPCICGECIAVPTPHFFDHRNLLKRREVGQATAECQRSFAPVHVGALLDGIGSSDVSMRDAKADASAAPPVRRLKIFLASSSELADDRDAFELHFRRLNDGLRAEGLYLEIVRWEHFLDAMSTDGLQAEYNRAIQACHVFVSLFFTKSGQFTEQEFDVAHARFEATGAPRIYTYFKNAAVDMGDLGKEVLTLLAFKDKLRALKHYHSTYKNLDDLNLQFRDQLKFLREALDLR